MRCGLLGEKLGHSYSKAIHERLGGYSYELIECPRAELDAFMKGGSFDAINVTIPYKKAVIPYCAALSPIAERIGSVNAVIRQRDGSLYGDNTDAYGFMSMVKKSGVDIAGKKAIVLGSGGASATICAVLNELNAKSVAVISRSGQDNYENIHKHADAEIIVNTTPVGMYPNTGVSPVDLSVFKGCKGVLDIVYNPHGTALLMQAEELGIPCMGGLNMLVAQAKRAAELFTGTSIPDSRTDEIERELSLNMQNIVLIGMPGCGKSTIAAALGKRLNRAVRDSDEATEAQAGMSIPQIFALHGEDAFRRSETEALSSLGRQSGLIISTGGGCVTRRENYPLLHQNGIIIWLTRSIDALPTDGRPISQRSDMHALYAARKPLYERFCDIIIDNNGSVESTVESITEALK